MNGMLISDMPVNLAIKSAIEEVYWRKEYEHPEFRSQESECKTQETKYRGRDSLPTPVSCILNTAYDYAY